MLTFDGVNKLIILDSAQISADEIWSRWVDWVSTSDNARFLPAMRNVGGDPLSDTKKLGITFFLINGWRVRPMEANHRLILDGNLYTDPSGFSPFVPTVGNYNVVVEMQVSNLTDVTASNLGDVSDAVWNAEIPANPIAGTWASLLKKVLTVAKFIGLK
jgi:hypothetical protein